jgi:exodeoxyribonuclease-5
MFDYKPNITAVRTRTGPPSGPGLRSHRPADGPRNALTAEQLEAAGGIKKWLYQTDRPVFAVQGLAGVGKTELLARIAQTPLAPLVCAPTGRAASVLRERFGIPAKTIHSQFHRLKSESRRANGWRLEFAPRRQAGSMAGKVMLIDESSMVPATMVEQLLATGVRIIAFGDPGQLPPVNGEPGFPDADFTLTQIHRQAAGSPIIRQAHAVRAGGNYAPDGDAFQVVPKGSHELLRRAHVVLCWRNDTRRQLNQLIRRVVANGAIPGRPADDGSFDPVTEYPRAGERVVILKNNPQFDLWNGDRAQLAEDLRPGDRSVSIFKVSEDGGSASGVKYPLLSFAGMPETNGDPAGLQLDFGCAVTVHKAQGSEWPFVVLLDEFPHNPERSRWVYTALTRASQRIVVVNRHYR